MAITIKVPVSELKKLSICEHVEDALKNDPENAYTASGIMIEVFGVKKSAIENKPFKEWGEDQKLGKLPTLYGRIRNCLEKSVEAGSVLKKHDGKRDLYWWNKNVHKNEAAAVEEFYSKVRKQAYGNQEPMKKFIKEEPPIE